MKTQMLAVTGFRRTPAPACHHCFSLIATRARSPELWGSFPEHWALSCSLARSSPGPQPQRAGHILALFSRSFCSTGTQDEGARGVFHSALHSSAGSLRGDERHTEGTGDMCEVLSKLAVCYISFCKERMRGWVPCREPQDRLLGSSGHEGAQVPLLCTESGRRGSQGRSSHLGAVSSPLWLPAVRTCLLGRCQPF